MITQEEIKKLNKIKTSTLAVSLYLNTDQKYYSPEQILVNQKNLLKKVKNLISEKNYKEILSQIKLELDKNIRGVVFFINPEEKIFHTYQFGKPFLNEIHVEKNLHLKPLVNILDEYERYGVVVLDKEKARVFSVYLGEIEDLSDIFNEFPGKHDSGGWGGWSQGRFQRHIEDHERRHLKEVAKKIFDLFQEKKFDRLILGGSKEVLPEFKKVLHSYLKEKLAGEFLTEMFKNNQHILDQSLVIEEKIEREKEKEKVEKLLNNLGKGNQAVAGLENVLKEAQKRKIMQLVVNLGYQRPGFRCQNCGVLMIKKDSQCSYCKNKIEEVSDIIDEVTQQVISQNGEVEFVKENKELEKAGNIGAMLRF